MKHLLKQAALGALAVALIAGLGGCSAEAQRKKHLERANVYYDKGEFQKAEIEYLSAARGGKQLDPKIVTRLGTIYQAQGRAAEAQAVLVQARQLNPEDLETRYLLGQALVSMNRLREAREEALFILGKRPADEKGALLLADASTGPENIAAAHEKLTEIARGGVETWAVHVAQAQLFLREKKMPEAEAEMAAAGKLNDKAPELNVLRAVLAMNRNQTNAAEVFLRTAQTNSPAHSPHKMQLARLKLEEKDVPAAKKLLDALLKETPDYVPAWAMRGQIAMSEGDLAECDRVAESVLSWDPRHYDIRMMRARVMVMRQQIDKALLEFAQIDSLYPHTPEVKYETAVAHVMLGSVDEALKRLDEALRVNPGYPPAMLLRAELKLRGGSVAEAMIGLLPYVKAYPDNFRARMDLAQAYTSLGQLDQALGLYREMAAQAPEQPEFPARIGFLLARQGKLDEARASYEAALKVSPLHLNAAEQLIDLDLQKKDFAAAGQRVAAQLALHTNSAAAMMLDAKLAMAKGDIPRAKTILKEVTKKAPDASQLYVLLAQIYSGSGDSAAALAEYKKAVDANPKDVSAQLQLGMAYDGGGDFANARKHYEAVVKLNPRVAPAWNNLAYLLSEKFNELDGAAAAAAKARELQPNDPETADTVGWVHFRKREFPQALALLRESSARLTNNPDVTYHRARAEYSMGLESEALASFKKFLGLRGNPGDIQDAKERLAVLDAAASAQMVPSLEAFVKKDATDYLAAFRLGEAYEASGTADKAAASFERAAQLNPNVPGPFAKLAAVYADKLNNLPKALESANTARKLAPNDAVIAGLLGRISLRSGDYANALALLQENAKSRAPDVGLLYDLGVAYYCVGQFEQTRTTLMDFAARNGAAPRIPETRDLLALLDFQEDKGGAEAAPKAASERLARDKNDLPALMTQGLILEKEGKYLEAAQRYEQILGLNRSFARAQRQLALLYSERLAKDDKAIDLATQARQTFVKDIPLAKALGKSAFRKGDYRLCATVLSQVTAQSPADAESFYYLGLAYEKSGQLTEAKQSLASAVSAAPDSASAKEAKAALERLK